MRKNLISSLVLVMTVSTFSMSAWAEDEISDDAIASTSITDGLTPDDVQQMASEDEMDVPGE